jgi:hypothetical protein
MRRLVGRNGEAQLGDAFFDRGVVRLLAVEARVVLIEDESFLPVAGEPVRLRSVEQHRRIGLLFECALEEIGGVGEATEREHGLAALEQRFGVGLVGAGGGGDEHEDEEHDGRQPAHVSPLTLQTLSQRRRSSCDLRTDAALTVLSDIRRT